jgi:hypothetical protein
MPRLPIAVQTLSRTAAEITYSAPQVVASGGNYFANDGRTFLHFKFDGTAPATFTMTIETPGTVDGQAIAQRTQTLAKSKEYMIGPFPNGVYGQAGDVVYFDLGADITGMTMAVIRLP